MATRLMSDSNAAVRPEQALGFLPAARLWECPLLDWVLGLSVLYIIFQDPDIVTVCLGASSIALLPGLGADLCKAADVGADLVGKVEAVFPKMIVTPP